MVVVRASAAAASASISFVGMSTLMHAPSLNAADFFRDIAITISFKVDA
jgi:hypothetical protein